MLHSPDLDRANVELYRLLFERAVDSPIVALDTTGNVITCSPGAERVHGYSAEEVIGRPHTIFYPEEDVAAGKPQRDLEIGAATGRFESEGWRVRKDGSRFESRNVIAALRQPDGELAGFAQMVRELPASRAEDGEKRGKVDDAQRDAWRRIDETRRALRAAERRTRLLIEVGDVLSASLDYQTSLRQLARLVVPDLADWCAVEAVNGGTPTRPVAVAHVNPEKVRLAEELWRRYPQAPEEDIGPARVMRTGKPELYTEVTDDMLKASAKSDAHLAMLRDLQLKSAIVAPLTARGHTLGTIMLVSAESARRFGDEDVALAMDVARRAALSIDNARLHAEAVEARVAAERAAETKTRFLAVMSHELRTPLNAISGYAELIALGLRGPVTDAQKRDLERITENKSILLSIINNILDYAKLESGRVTFDVHFVNARHEVLELQTMVAPQLEAKGITYDCSECDAALRLCVDPSRLRQILMNLLSNAIKFTGSGGRISVSCGADPEAAWIRVADTGVGIPADKLESIFEPFVQIRESSQPQSGAGLGLAISRDLARQLRGELAVKSEVGVGSTFTLTLPAVTDGTACHAPRPEPQSGEQR